MDYCLLGFKKGIRRIDAGRGLADFFSPAPCEGAQHRLQPGNPLINEETGYEQERMREIVEGNLNDGQRRAVERILESVNGEPQIFFLQDPGGTESVANILNAALKSSELWPQVVQLKLTENMRLTRHGITAAHAAEFRQFADWLLEVGAGRCNDNNGHVKIPPYIRVISPDDGLPVFTAAIYGDVSRNELLEADGGIQRIGVSRSPPARNAAEG
jgi:hypothetical protein